MGWACGAYGWGEGVYKVLLGKPVGKRPMWRPRRRWVDNIRMDLKEVECGYMDWIGLAEDGNRWRTLVSAVMNLLVPWNVGNFLTSCKPVSCSSRTVHHGISKRGLLEMAVFVDRFRMAKNRNHRWISLNSVLNFLVPRKYYNFWFSWIPISFWKAPFHGAVSLWRFYAFQFLQGNCHDPIDLVGLRLLIVHVSHHIYIRHIRWSPLDVWSVG